MIIDFEISEEKLKEKIEGHDEKKNIVIWGSGNCAEQFLHKIPLVKSRILCYVDKNEKKWGTQIEGSLVVSPQDFFVKYLDDTDIIFIATMYFDDILKKINGYTYKGIVYSAFHIVFRYGQCDYRPLEKNMDECKKFFCDDRSKYILDFILDHRKRMDINYREICEPNQYFISNIVPVVEDAVFVDGGAYHGETIDDFITFQKGKYRKIYSFEMDYNNYLKLKEKKYEDNVRIMNFGLWNERMKCSYSSEGTSSSLECGDSNAGDMTAECISLDEVIGRDKVTLIKMDIEGAEKKALYGARKCIQRCKPDLAICVYHKPEDIYELTKLIHEWLPDHKLYLRHHCWNFTETVLYAINSERDLNS